jgi:hypothetical protein
VGERDLQPRKLLRGAGYHEGSYSHADREWVDQVLSYHWSYFGVLRVHTPDAVAVGVRLEAIEALHEGREQDLTDDERLLAHYIRQVADGAVTDETESQILDRLGPRGLGAYILFICHLLRVLRSFQTWKIELQGDRLAGRGRREHPQHSGRQDQTPGAGCSGAG